MPSSITSGLLSPLADAAVAATDARAVAVCIQARFTCRDLERSRALHPANPSAPALVFAIAEAGVAHSHRPNFHWRLTGGIAAVLSDEESIAAAVATAAAAAAAAAVAAAAAAAAAAF